MKHRFYMFLFMIIALTVTSCENNVITQTQMPNKIQPQTLTPVVTKICPKQRVVSLAKLGLSSEDRLIVVPFDDPLNYSPNGLASIDPLDLTIQPIKNTSSTVIPSPIKD